MSGASTPSSSIPWVDGRGQRAGEPGISREFNSAIGPTGSGLRFHPSVNLSIWAGEQIFKNNLTCPWAAGQFHFIIGQRATSALRSFATELFRHIGPDTDVPASDIGVVGSRESDTSPGSTSACHQQVHQRAHRQGPQLGQVAGQPGALSWLRVLRREMLNREGQHP